MTLMRLGGYDDVRVIRAEGPYLHTADGRRLRNTTVMVQYQSEVHGGCDNSNKIFCTTSSPSASR